MKVLWFANTPCNANEHFNSKLKGTGGWLKALDQNLSDKVDLHIAFYHPNAKKSFTYNDTDYYPICTNKNSAFKRYWDKLRGKVTFKEDLHKYIEVIDQVQPDIIHIHGTEEAFAYLITEVNIPVVVSIQGNLTVYKHKYYSGILKKNSKISKSLRHALVGNYPFDLSYRAFRKRALREQEMLKSCKYIIGRTFWDKYITRILAPESEYYIGQEILRDGFYINQWKAHYSANKTIFTTNGNTVYKGFETLCHSLNLLNQDADVSVIWKVAGICKSDEIVQATKKQLGNDFPNNNLVLMGQLSEEELIKELLASDVYVMPSHIENSPNNLCEAMLLGMPCIATYSGGTGEMLEQNKDGILIQDGDPWVMAGAVKELIFNEKLAFDLSSNAKERSSNRHNQCSIVDNLINTYKLISSKS